MKSVHSDAAEVLETVRRARMVFQPIVDLAAWRVTGFEALARFEDGTTPLGLLERAEAAGARESAEIELIRIALTTAEELPLGMPVTYNASGTTILRPELADLLATSDRLWGLELFEAATAADLGEVRAAVTRLGGLLLVDDAGAACADASRITTLQPDVVKIDRALFWKIGEDANAREMLGELLVAARDAGSRVLVEGISDAEQVERAHSIGADLAQGFHLGVPTAPDRVPDMLADLHRRIGVDSPGL